MPHDTDRSFLDRAISLRMVVLLLLLGGVGAVAASWLAVSQATRADQGRLGKMALEVARGPDQALKAISETRERFEGTWADRALRVSRGAEVSIDGFSPIDVREGLTLDGLMIRTGPAPVTPAWRFLAGGFYLNGAPRNAAVLISPELEVVHAWTFTEAGLEGANDTTEHNIFVHGIDLLPDLSVIHTFDNGLYIQRLDACSARTWTTQGAFHHSVQLSADQASVWTLLSTGVAEVDVADGKILRQFTLPDLIAKNPDIALLEIHRTTEDSPLENIGETGLAWNGEPVHFNDADPLPPRLAAAFPSFDAGDVVVSSRSLNALFVLDPDSGVIKWWRAGAFQRQHDPDWLPSGEILVFNNRIGREESTIVAIDPETYALREVHNGADTAFYSRIRGKHQIYANGTLAVTSAQQGRVFELTADGEMALEILNTRPRAAGELDTPKNYALSEMRTMPADFLDEAALMQLACAEN